MKHIALAILALITAVAIYLSLTSRNAPPASNPKAPAAIAARQNLSRALAPRAATSATEGSDIGTVQHARTTQETMIELCAAMDSADVDRISTSIKLDTESRSRIEALIARLPEEAKAQYATPEKLVAMYYAVAPIDAVEVVSERRLSSGDVVQSVKIRPRGEREAHTDEILFHEEAGRWRMIVPLRHVERIVEHVKEPRKAQL